MSVVAKKSEWERETLAARLVPALARQAAIRVVDPSSTVATTRVVKLVFEVLGLEASVVPCAVVAYRREAWSTTVVGSTGAMPQHVDRGERGGHLCVESAGVLVDASLDLLAEPNRGISLRPSSFRLPTTWPMLDEASFCQSRSGLVVAYRRLADETWKDCPDWSGRAVLFNRLVHEVVDTFVQAEDQLTGSARAPDRWESVTTVLAG